MIRKKYIQTYKTRYNTNIKLIDEVFNVSYALDIFLLIKGNTIIFAPDYKMEQHHI